MNMYIEIEDILIEHGLLFVGGVALRDDIFINHKFVSGDHTLVMLPARMHPGCVWMVLE